MSKHKKRISFWTVVMVAFICVGLAGVFLEIKERFEGNKYVSLAERIKLDADIDNPRIGPRVDFEELKKQNPDVCAWLKLDGTNIDLPVVMQDSNNPDYYLYHDFWRENTLAGCPYLDFRCDPTSGHDLVFGHHITNRDYAFSQLFDRWIQERFNELGEGWWITEDNAVLLKPLCALRVLNTYEDIQYFDLEGSERTEWLTALVNESTAAVENSDEIINESTRVITCVTCSELSAGRPWRCLVVYAGIEMPS